MNLIRLLVVSALGVVSVVTSSTCNNFNNDCRSCIQYAGEEGSAPVHSCTFCPVDGICHTVGSLFNKCSNSECISLSEASTCELKTVQDCNNVSPYGNFTN